MEDSQFTPVIDIEVDPIVSLVEPVDDTPVISQFTCINVSAIIFPMDAIEETDESISLLESFRLPADNIDCIPTNVTEESDIIFETVELVFTEFNPLDSPSSIPPTVRVDDTIVGVDIIAGRIDPTEDVRLTGVFDDIICGRILPQVALPIIPTNEESDVVINAFTDAESVLADTEFNVLGKTDEGGPVAETPDT